MDKVKAITNHEGLCWKCLQSFDKSKIHNIHIGSLGYGSAFDGVNTKLQLCDNCYEKSNPEIWSMKTHQYNDYCEKYICEEEMLAYINGLPIQGQQFVKNEFATGWNADNMKPQDWIDYELDILPHEKCKEYGMYSPQEIKAYNNRFQSCEYVTNRIWNDKSKASYCPFGASGDYGQKCSCNISTECYECKYYTKRTTPIKDVDNNDFKDYMEYLRLKIREDELRKRFE